MVATVIGGDLLTGSLFANFFSETGMQGDYRQMHYVLKHNDYDLLVLGSSVALASIDPRMIEDSLGIKSYNGGGNGQLFPYFITMLKGALKTHKPEKVILCVSQGAFISDGLGSRYYLLAPYYGQHIADIESNLDKDNPMNHYFYKSSAYRLNNIWMRILLQKFVKEETADRNGHVAKVIPASPPEKLNFGVGRMNSERRQELKEFMDICRSNGIELTIIFPPEFIDFQNLDDPRNVYNEVRDLAKEYGVRVYEDYNLMPFDKDASLFYDKYHINEEGVKIYMDTLLRRLRQH